MYITKEFVAYCRKLLRALTKIENALNAGNSVLAKELVKELKEDAERDIEA